MRILLVEDDPKMARLLRRGLEEEAHVVDVCADGLLALEQAQAVPYDVIALDWSLPGMDGLSVLRELRAGGLRTPVLMLTARGTSGEKVMGLRSGADDYLTKPFALAELTARCLALSQRYRLGVNHVLQIGPLEIDRQSGVVRRAGETLRMTAATYRILRLVAEAHPRTLPRFELSRGVWGEDPPDSDSLRSHIHLLRQVLDKPFAWPMLETVHGIGFRLRVEP